MSALAVAAELPARHAAVVTRPEAVEMATERLDVLCACGVPPAAIRAHAIGVMRAIKTETDVSLFVKFDAEGSARFS